MDPRKPVVRHARVQMVDVLEADVRRSPMKPSRQVVEGAALDGRLGVLPLVVAPEVGPGNLMLDVEEPDREQRGQVDHRDVDEQERLPAEDGDQRAP